MAQNVLEKKAVMNEFSGIREALLYEVLMEGGLDGFMKKFNVERQARPLVDHSGLFGI